MFRIKSVDITALLRENRLFLNRGLFMTKKVNVIKLDEDHRLYIYRKKIVYKERKGGKLVTRFSGLDFNALLTSPVIDDHVRRKLAELVQKLG